MKYLIYSISGDGAGFAWRLLEEGNDVEIFIKEPFFKGILKGLVPHVNSLEEGLSHKPDVVIFDMNGDGKVADATRKRGFRCVGGGRFNDMLEMDRTYGMSLAKRLGIKTPEFTVFKQNQIEEAIAFIHETNGRYVLKPHGNLALDLTYVASDAEDMIHELEWIDRQGIMKGDFILQDFVDGWEISTEGWFSNGNPIPALANGTMERKKFLTGDLGCQTGSESSVVWPYGTDRTKIFQKTLWKMYPILKEMKFTGPIDINAIISKQDGQPYFLEFTPRFGYSAFYALAELIDGHLGQFFYDIALGKLDDISLKNDQVSMALTLSIPPYPLDSGKDFNHKALQETKGKPIIHLPEDGHWWPYDMAFDDSVDQFVTAGTLGLICFATNSGSSVEEAEDKTYEIAQHIGIPNVQYRIDGAEKVMEHIPEIKQMEYDGPYCKREEMETKEEDAPEIDAVGVGEEEED